MSSAVIATEPVEIVETVATEAVETEPINYTLCAVLGTGIEIRGTGPAALVTLFRYLVVLIRGIGGLDAFYAMSPTEAAKFLMDGVTCDDPEVFRVLNELLFTRCPRNNIQQIVADIENQIEESYVNCEAGEMVMPFYMNLAHLVPEYYQLLADNDNPSDAEVAKAWLTDLRYGIYTTDRAIILRDTVEEDRDLALARRIVNNGLRDHLMAVPRAMLRRARLLRVYELATAFTL